MYSKLEEHLSSGTSNSPMAAKYVFRKALPGYKWNNIFDVFISLHGYPPRVF